MRLPAEVAAVWAELATVERSEPVQPFDASTLSPLPGPAQRWLRRALPPGTPLVDTVELSMVGGLKLGSRWMEFTARQIIRAGVGFVWAPVVGGRLLRFVGADLLGPRSARMEFRLHGLVPVVRATGPDVARSATGRLAAETVAWVPQAATPQAGARWRAVDDHVAAVTLVAAGEPVEVRVTVGDDGRLTAVELQRWDTTREPPSERAFGGDITGEHTLSSGVVIAGSGLVGWDYRTPTWSDGAFFRYAVTSATEAGAPRAGPVLSRHERR